MKLTPRGRRLAERGMVALQVIAALAFIAWAAWVAGGIVFDVLEERAAYHQTEAP